MFQGDSAARHSGKFAAKKEQAKMPLRAPAQTLPGRRLRLRRRPRVPPLFCNPHDARRRAGHQRHRALQQARPPPPPAHGGGDGPLQAFAAHRLCGAGGAQVREAVGEDYGHRNRLRQRSQGVHAHAPRLHAKTADDAVPTAHGRRDTPAAPTAHGRRAQAAASLPAHQTNVDGTATAADDEPEAGGGAITFTSADAPALSWV
mmetsp:Transcript_26780/g.90157  ORF Transcript_26780/g.90157 Transcript_26780/m.90157 type:complete len:203 (-) Transcript_26780:951-1559(-)